MTQMVIGVTPLYDVQRDSVWMIPGYLDGITQAGGIPVIFPLDCGPKQLHQLFDMVDGVLFTGGQDVDPALYGEQRRETCGEICQKRDIMERELLQMCRIHQKPAFGICRGIQLFNAALGGTLYQDLEHELTSEIRHHMAPTYNRAVHCVQIDGDSLLYRIVGEQNIAVNSYHHQGVRELASTLTACAWSADGLLEAVEDRRQPFFLATQWHPELFWRRDENSRKLFRAFVNACRESRNRLGYIGCCDIL